MKRELINTDAARYSGTPLAKKLGFKKGFKVGLINAPDYYSDLFSDLPADMEFSDDAAGLKNLIHFFVFDKAQYLDLFPKLKSRIVPSGSIWVSWPKKSSKTHTDITESIIRTYALENGMVDVKVCAVDETWSGLKLVFRLKNR